MESARKCLVGMGLLGCAALAAASGTARANLLVNGGFEDPITFDGAPFVGSWEGFSNGPGSASSNSSVLPRNGVGHLLLLIDHTDNTFAGAFQDVAGLIPGSPAVFSGWHATPSSPLDVTVEMRIEWRNSVSNTEISRTPNLTTAPGAAYSQFTVASLVPAGADTARVVYAIQSFSPEPTNTGTVYVDDVSFDVPEPGSIALIGLAGLGLATRRRSR